MQVQLISGFRFTVINPCGVGIGIYHRNIGSGSLYKLFACCTFFPVDFSSSITINHVLFLVYTGYNCV